MLLHNKYNVQYNVSNWTCSVVVEAALKSSLNDKTVNKVLDVLHPVLLGQVLGLLHLHEQ